jgi:twitching motility protein PilT
MDLNINEMLRKMVDKDASDLHISAGNPPIIRVQGRLTKLPDYPVLSEEQVEDIILKILTGQQNEKLVETKELDFSYNLPGVSRFRGNVLVEKDSLGAVFRAIPSKPQTMEQLSVPEVMRDVAMKTWGLILVTGPSGSGKSTTLASIIDYLNDVRNAHVITIEDPIEYVYKSRRCLIRQREVGINTLSFDVALRAALRQDPDIILVGEMRDRETVETCLEAAETGHLVFSTLHTNNAPDSIFRILSVFDQDRQKQIRFQVASTLRAILSQLLLPHAQRGKKRVLCTELLIATPAIRNLIREGNIHMIRSTLETGSEHKMHTMDQTLKVLYEAGKVSLETALAHAIDQGNFKKLCGMEADVGEYSQTAVQSPYKLSSTMEENFSKDPYSYYQNKTPKY